MSTMAQVVDRVFRDWLSRPDDTQIGVSVSTGVDAAVTSLVLADELTVEEEAAISPGRLIEVEYEMMRVTAYDEATRTATVTRGFSGTTPAAHAAGTVAYISPTWPRHAVFDAACDGVEFLFPSLWATKAILVPPSSDPYPLDDPYLVDVRSARTLIGGRWETTFAELWHGFGETFSLPAAVVPASGDTWITCRRRFPRPSLPADNLTLPLDQGGTFGLDPSWEGIVVLSAVATLVAGRDIDPLTREFLTETMEAQGADVNTSARLSNMLEAMRDRALARASRALTAHQGINRMVRRTL